MPGWIYPAEDEDWFAFAAQEHATYRLEVSPGTQEPQVDPLLRLLGRDGAQTLIVDEDGGQGETARIEWVAPVTDTFYVSVAAGHTSATGTYSILLAEDLDDHADSADGATPIDADASLSGRIDHVGDGDWFAFAAEIGATYRASVSPGTRDNPFLRLIGRDGLEMLRIDEAGGQGSAAHIEWTAPASGEYYLSVSAGLADATGSYTVTLEAEADDHASNADGATALSAGGYTAGRLENEWDQDWFRLAAIEGTEYTFSTPSAPAGTQVQLVGSDGATRLITEAPGPADPSRIEWTAPVNGTYYLAVRSAANGEPGNYAISVSSKADDYPDVPADAASLGVDTPILGTLETRGDEDWFSFTVSEGWLYRISLALGSLPDSTLTLLDQNGTSRIQVSADESPFIEWMAPISGTYYLRVRAPLGASTGSYTLSMSAEGDDHSDESPGAAEIGTDGSPVTGKIETAGDLDWFSFPVLPQTRYTITLVSDSLRTARMDLRGAVIVNGVARDGIGYASGTTHYADPGTPT
ncbi:MAG: pre-peptidase C-terminal domain-containing protein, partial [Chloroflexi bacterium]|nr:pre-peptidase C-terminal domain-containing protein [Chloroflexota bacterium]